jgi:formiminotetrahydrofolate cyclodeaminase
MTETQGFSQHTIQQFLSELAAKSPTPGGGAAAPICGAVGAALANMVVSYSLGKKNLAEHQPALESAASALSAATRRFQALAEEDAVAYSRMNELQRLPEDDPRRGELDAATSKAVEVPVQVLALCAETLELCARLAGISNKHLLSDLAIAAVLLDACARSSRWNVLINTGPGSSALNGADDVLVRIDALRAQVEKACSPG